MSSKINPDIDLLRFPYILYLLIVILISKIPFINLGFSSFASQTDQDVLAVVNSAYLLRYDHIYAVSRFPGSPVYEIANSLIIGGGWIATNMATVLVSIVCVLLFGKILNILDIKNKALLLITFAFIPLIWINSTVTMDYMWSLMFLLLAFYFMLEEKVYFSAIAFSFSIGCRMTSVIMALSLLFLMLHKKYGIKKILNYFGISSAVSIIIFSPVFYRYGLGFLKYTPREIPFDEVFYGMTTQLLSIPAMLVIIIALVMAREFPKKDFSFNLSLSVVFVYTLLFIYHPSKPAYLIPAVPWGLIILSKIFSRIIVVLICMLIILNGVISVEIQSNEKLINFGEGSVLKNYEDRKSSGINISMEYLDSLSIALSEENIKSSSKAK